MGYFIQKLESLHVLGIPLALSNSKVYREYMETLALALLRAS